MPCSTTCHPLNCPPAGSGTWCCPRLEKGLEKVTEAVKALAQEMGRVAPALRSEGAQRHQEGRPVQEAQGGLEAQVGLEVRHWIPAWLLDLSSFMPRKGR